MKLTIRNKLLIPIISIVIITMLSSSFWITSLVDEQLTRLFNTELEVVNLTLSKNVNNTALGYKRDIVSLAITERLSAFITAVEQRDTKRMAATRPAIDRLFDDYRVVYEHFPVMNVAGADGVVIAGTNKEAIGNVNVGQREYFQASMRGETVFSPPLVSMDTNDKAIVLSTPILNTAGKPAAVLYVLLPCSDIVKNTVEGIRIGKTGFAFLVDSGGLILAHTDSSRIQKLDVRTMDWGREILSKDTGMIHYTSSQGVARVCSFKKDKESGWIAVSTIDETEVTDTIAYLRMFCFGIMFVGVVIMSLVVFFVARPIIRDLLVGVGFATAVAGGDLNKAFPTVRDDELGSLFDALRSMVANLKANIDATKQESERAIQESRKAQEAMTNAEHARGEAQTKTQKMLLAADKLEEIASSVSSASAELSAQIEQSERGAAEQASRITETATAMEEMNSTVLEVAKSAGSAADASVMTRSKAESGAQIVRKAVQSIQQVQEQSMRLKEDMHKLDENAKSVSHIMGVISDIADQTNLLALNAAIEAARAGDAGRGFAVVADEVRKLAEKTMSSTTDVGNAIQAIQQSATQSMTQMDLSITIITEATQLANQSGAALDEIVQMVDNTADQVRSIATASEQQSASSDEINRSIIQVNAIAGETAQAMEEAARAVSDLAKQSQFLTGLIDDMKRS